MTLKFHSHQAKVKVKVKKIKEQLDEIKEKTSSIKDKFAFAFAFTRCERTLIIGESKGGHSVQFLSFSWNFR